MAEPAAPAKIDMAPPDMAGACATLESLRAQGGQHWDPIRFHFLETLAQRADAQPEAVRRVLHDRLQSALTDYTHGWQRSQEAVPESAPVPPPAASLMALRGLNQALQAFASDEGGPPSAAVGRSGPVPMKSVRAFQQTWSRIRTQDRLDAALRAGPENAGPLNSHMLVLRSLERMRAISPAYVQRFVSHVDALLCLDKLGARPGGAASVKPARVGRSRK
jgi:hypothetical protein